MESRKTIPVSVLKKLGFEHTACDRRLKSARDTVGTEDVVRRKEVAVLATAAEAYLITKQQTNLFGFEAWRNPSVFF